MARAPVSTVEAFTLTSVEGARSRGAGLASALDPASVEGSARARSLQGTTVEFVILLTLKAVSS